MNKKLLFFVPLTVTFCVVADGVVTNGPSIAFSSNSNRNYYIQTEMEDVVINKNSKTIFRTFEINSSAAILTFSQSELGELERLQSTQKDGFHYITTSENLIKEIDTEFENLDLELYDKEIQKSFSDSAEQLKTLLMNVNVKGTPDILTFHKGYFGLVWNAKDDDSIYLYSIPGGKLFYNKVNKYSDVVRRVNPEKKAFEELIKEINLMV